MWELSAAEMAGTMEQGPKSGIWEQPWLRASKTGTIVLQPQGTKCCQQPKWSWKQILPQSLQVRAKPAWHPDFSPMRPQAEKTDQPARLLTNCQLINGFCFKVLFVVICYAAIAN